MKGKRKWLTLVAVVALPAILAGVELLVPQAAPLVAALRRAVEPLVQVERPSL